MKTNGVQEQRFAEPGAGEVDGELETARAAALARIAAAAGADALSLDLDDLDQVYRYPPARD